MTEQEPHLQLYEIPPEVCELTAQACGAEPLLAALARRRTAKTAKKWQSEHENQDLSATEKQVWQWLFGRHDSAMKPQEKRRVVKRTLFVAQELKPLFDRCEGLQTGTFSDEFVAELTQTIFNIAPVFTDWHYTRQLDHNSIPYTQQRYAQMRNTITHVFSMLDYADKTVPVFNKGLKEKYPGMGKQIDLNRFKVFILLHDLGRWITQDQDVHERVERFIFEILGIPKAVLDFEFEAMARLSSDDPSLFDVTRLPIEKSLTVALDISAKGNTEQSQKELRPVDVDYVARTPGLRAIHYFAHNLVSVEPPHDDDVPRPFAQRVEQRQAELEAAFSRLQLSELQDWLVKFFEQLERAGKPVAPALITKYLNETAFYQQLIPFIDEICVAGGQSFAGIRAEVNAIFDEKMENGTFHHRAVNEPLPAESHRAQTPVSFYQQIALLELVLADIAALNAQADPSGGSTKTVDQYIAIMQTKMAEQQAESERRWLAFFNLRQ